MTQRSLSEVSLHRISTVRTHLAHTLLTPKMFADLYASIQLHGFIRTDRHSKMLKPMEAPPSKRYANWLVWYRKLVPKGSLLSGYYVYSMRLFDIRPLSFVLSPIDFPIISDL